MVDGFSFSSRNSSSNGIEIELEDLSSKLSFEDEHFKKIAVPGSYMKLDRVLTTKCCDNFCNMYITQIDCLYERLNFINFVADIEDRMKNNKRRLFFQSIAFVGISKNLCLSILSRIYGCSISRILMFMDDDKKYQTNIKRISTKTIEKKSSILFDLKKIAQRNPGGGLILPTSAKIIDKEGKVVNVQYLRKKCKLKIRRRKRDLLVRCSTCIALSHMVRVEKTEKQKAQKMLDDHYLEIEGEKVVVSTLEKMSRSQDYDICLFQIDGMSSRLTKLPIVDKRSKSIQDGERLIIDLHTVQIALRNNACDYKNYEYVGIDKQFKRDSNYILSIFLRSLKELPFVPAHFVIVLDNCKVNKSDIFIGGLSVILAQLPKLEKITILYPTVGHTHGQVDAHFGNLSNKLQVSECLDVREFEKVLRDVPSVKKVVDDPSIYDFSVLKPHLNQWKYRAEAHQMVISKSFDGTLQWGCAESITTESLFCYENSDTFDVFEKDFDPCSFRPTLIKPDESGMCMANVEKFIDKMGPYLNSQMANLLRERVELSGKLNFAVAMSLIDQKPSKKPQIPQSSISTSSIIDYLVSHGYKVSKAPRNPVPY